MRAGALILLVLAALAACAVVLSRVLAAPTEPVAALRGSSDGEATAVDGDADGDARGDVVKTSLPAAVPGATDARPRAEATPDTTIGTTPRSRSPTPQRVRASPQRAPPSPATSSRRATLVRRSATRRRTRPREPLYSADTLAAAGLDGEDAVGRLAYEAVLAEQHGLPITERRYVYVRPRSGFGNRVLAIRSALALSIATGRALVVDPALAAPLFPLVFGDPASPFRGPFYPLMKTAGSRGTAILRDIASRESGALLCWARRRALDACNLRAPRLLNYIGNHPLFWLMRRTHDVVVPLRRRLRAVCGTLYEARGTKAVRLWAPPLAGVAHAEALAPATAAVRALLAEDTARGCAARAHLRFPTLMSSVLLTRPTALMRRAISAAEARVRWDGAAARLGVQVRSFVDARPTAIAPAFWECVARRASEWLVARGHGALPPERVLLFVASDTTAARAPARAALGAIGRVEWLDAPPERAGRRRRHFVHTNVLHGTHGDAVLMARVLADWDLLSRSDLVFATPRSSFGFSAATARPGGTPIVRAALDGSECVAPALYVDRWDSLPWEVERADAGPPEFDTT